MPDQLTPNQPMPDQPTPRGMYFEDFKVGESYTTPRRTITQTDIINFANLSGDFNAPHVDFEFCKRQPYGEIIAHGPLVLAIAGGLACQSGINDGTTAVGIEGSSPLRTIVCSHPVANKPGSHQPSCSRRDR